MDIDALRSAFSDESLVRQAAQEARVLAAEAREESRVLKDNVRQQVILDTAKAKGIQMSPQR